MRRTRRAAVARARRRQGTAKVVRRRLSAHGYAHAPPILGYQSAKRVQIRVTAPPRGLRRAATGTPSRCCHRKLLLLLRVGLWVTSSWIMMRYDRRLRWRMQLRRASAAAALHPPPRRAPPSSHRRPPLPPTSVKRARPERRGRPLRQEAPRVAHVTATRNTVERTPRVIDRSHMHSNQQRKTLGVPRKCTQEYGKTIFPCIEKFLENS